MNLEPEKMANENMNAQQQGWFTSFTTGGQSPNSGEAGQTPSTFNTQTAISWLGQVRKTLKFLYFFFF